MKNCLGLKLCSSYSFFTALFILFFLASCQKEKKDPQITATVLTPYSDTRYKAIAKIIEKGDYPISDHGFVLQIGPPRSINYIPTGNKISLGATLVSDTFSSLINIGSNYYYSSSDKCMVSAYITNSRGTIYSTPIYSALLKFQLTSISPIAAKMGDTITIYGQNFSIDIASNTVTFNNIVANIVSVTNSSLKVIIPSGISTDYYSSYISIHVVSGSQSADISANFKLIAGVTNFYPNTGTWGTIITVYGTGLSNTSLSFNDYAGYTYSRTSNYISASIPSDFMGKKFKVYVNSSGYKIEVPGGYFTMTKMIVNPLTVLKYFPGSMIFLSGSGFNPSTALNTLLLGNVSIQASYNSGSTMFSIPNSMAIGNYSVVIYNGIDTVALSQKISIVKPVITGLSVDSGYPYSRVSLLGKNLYSNYQQNTSVFVGSQSSSIAEQDTSKINFDVPWLNPGIYSIYATLDNNTVQCPVNFKVLEPTLTSIVPSSGPAGSTVIINGLGFGKNTAIMVNFGSIFTYTLSATETKINVQVPAGIAKGIYIVKVYLSNNPIPTTLLFTVS